MLKEKSNGNGILGDETSSSSSSSDDEDGEDRVTKSNVMALLMGGRATKPDIEEIDGG